MSRTTRIQRSNAQPRKAQKVLVPVFMARLKRQIKRMMIADGRIANPATREPKFAWYWSLKMSAARDHGTTGGTIYADTKSQAKAQNQTGTGRQEWPAAQLRHHRGSPERCKSIR